MTAPVMTASPLLDAAAPRLDDHLRRCGPIPWRGAPGPLLDDLHAAGLTGRGGAGFPVARKLAAVLRAGPGGVVVGNGAEGEPASAKDRYLLAAAPHLVLDGLQLAAEAVGASAAHIVVPADAVPGVRQALAERAGLDPLPVGVLVATDHFLAGEESAVVAALDGRAPVPADKFRPVVRSGVGGRPTAVQNVETLAHLALVARHGPARFRAAGTAAEPGTMLVTVSGGVERPGVLEVALGAPLRRILAAAGRAHAGPVLVGGFHGAWLTADEVAGARLCAAGLRRYGAAPGAGVLVALPAGADGLVESARIVGYLAGQSSGRCGPCHNGLPRLADVLGRLAAGERHPRLVATALEQADLVAGRGACHHPDGTVRLVRSALRVFRPEFESGGPR
jgi:NADH:ubiquinone oxidoreductase subunit F (NADH-binding)